jgi:hypothetical protein
MVLEKSGRPVITGFIVPTGSLGFNTAFVVAKANLDHLELRGRICRAEQLSVAYEVRKP